MTEEEEFQERLEFEERASAEEYGGAFGFMNEPEANLADPQDQVSGFESLARGASQGLTRGYQDEISPYIEKGIAAIFGDGATKELYDQKSIDDLKQTYRDQNVAAEQANPLFYGGGKFAGVLPGAIATGGSGILSNVVASAADAGVTTLGEADRIDSESLIAAGKSAAIGGGLAGAFSAAPKLLARGYDKVAPKAKGAFARIRGISPDTIEAYADPVRRELIDDISRGYDTLAEGQFEKASQVADDIGRSRSNFITQKVSNVDKELVAAAERAQPIKLKNILDSIENEIGELQPVGSANKRAISGLVELKNDLLGLANQNIQEIPVNVVTKHGIYSASKLSDFAKNAMATQDTSATYLRPSTEILPKTPGGPKNLSFFKTNQAGDIKSVDPIMGPIRNRSAKNLNLEHSLSGKKISSAINRPENILPTEVVGADPFLTPRQMNRLRQTLNDESKAAYRNVVGQDLPGAASFRELGDTARKSLDEISTNIRSENLELSKLYEIEDALKAAGLKEQDIDPNKLRRLLTAGPTRSASETQAIKDLDLLLGTKLLKERELSRAAQELNPEGTLSKYLTGAQLGPAVLGGVGGMVLGPVAPAIGMATAALQAPILTKPIIRGAVKLDSIVTAIRTNPNAFGKYTPTLLKAAQRGATSLGATHFVLSQQDPEYREQMKQFESQEE